jgi:glycosyltransferase involved in cell wall biosynthesis
MTKVVILSAFLSPLRSGAEACAEEVAQSLHDRFDITIVTARLRRASARHDTIGDVPVVRIGLGCTFDKWLFPFLAPFVVRRLRPNIVHAILESYAGMAMVFCRFVYRAKYILTCQSTNTSLFLRLLHHMADRVTVISSPLQQRAKTLGVSNTVLIPNGLRLDAMPQRERVAGRVLFVGRLEHMKGVDTLLQALALIPQPHVHLRIVGSGSKHDDLQLLANRLGVRDRVEFLGYIPTPDVYEEYARAEVFCGLSRSEALGNVFLEAQAAGCAVVATRVGGIPDIVEDGVTGLLVASDDAKAAAAAMTNIFADDALRVRLSTASRQHAAGYDWSRIADQYAALYN